MCLYVSETLLGESDRKEQHCMQGMQDAVLLRKNKTVLK